MIRRKAARFRGARLAFAEIRRSRTRFGLLTTAVGLLAFLILFQQALLASLVTQFVGALRNQSAQVLVYGDDARRNVEGSRVTDSALVAVREVPGVERAEHMGEGTFTVTADGELRDAVVFGYELGGPGAPTTLASGRLPRQDGEAVASNLDRDDGFGPGETVRVESGGEEITVVGLARDLRFSVAPTLFVSYPTYVQARRAANPDATDVQPSLIAVTISPGENASEIASRISGSVDGVEALDRSRAAAESPGVAAVQQSLGIVLLLAYVAVALVTGFFFVILTVQKAEPLTLLRAIGAPSSLLVVALLTQVVAVVVVGNLVGAAMLAATARVMSGGLALSVDPRSITVTSAVILLLAIVASTAAVRRVLRIDPLRATTGAGVGYE